MQDKDTQTEEESKRGEALRVTYAEQGCSPEDAELMARVEVALGPVLGPVLTSTKLAWRLACAEWGPASPGAVGWLLHLVREAWGDPGATVLGPNVDGWRVMAFKDTADTHQLLVALGETEAEALVAALEARHAQG